MGCDGDGGDAGDAGILYRYLRWRRVECRLFGLLGKDNGFSRPARISVMIKMLVPGDGDGGS